MNQIINIIQIIVSVLLITAILFQQRGSGLSPVFGGESGAYRTRRGLEKGLFWATVGLGAVFLGTALLSIFLLS